MNVLSYWHTWKPINEKACVKRHVWKGMKRHVCFISITMHVKICVHMIIKVLIATKAECAHSKYCMMITMVIKWTYWHWVNFLLTKIIPTLVLQKFYHQNILYMLQDTVSIQVEIIMLKRNLTNKCIMLQTLLM